MMAGFVAYMEQIDLAAGVNGVPTVTVNSHVLTLRSLPTDSNQLLAYLQAAAAWRLVRTAPGGAPCARR